MMQEELGEDANQMVAEVLDEHEANQQDEIQSKTTLAKCADRLVLLMMDNMVEHQRVNRPYFDTTLQMMQAKVEPSVADQDTRSLMNHDG